jgi:hypothetical protein
MSGDVHVVITPGRVDPVHVFGHRSDAEAFRDAIHATSSAAAILSDEPVIDSATARALIEQEVAAS